MPANIQRPRFYEGQYLAADDLEEVTEYGREQLARHQLAAHTWGIVVGFSLIERASAGAPQRRDVILTPGMAVDGFGRQLVALAPVRITENLFANLPYDASVDDPANTGGVPPGRFVRIWIAYDEKQGKSPPPGFEQCDAGDEYARIVETHRIVIGDRLLIADRRSPISLAGQSMDAADALKRFNPTAPIVSDASIPHQQFPDDEAAARWLVPIGWVRWVAYSQGGGYFVDRNIDDNDKGDDRIRKVRQYAGSIAENILAADGALVLRNRGDDPTGNGKFQARLQSGDSLTDTLRDLVWVEGNLRVIGDGRLAGGALRLTDPSGKDQGTPLSVERLGDRPSVAGNRSLDALIGPDSQKDNRFAVATIVNDDPAPTKRQLSEKFTVLSNGNVGVGIDAPTQKLHVKGARIHFESDDGAKTLDLRHDGSQVDVQTTTNDLYLRSTAGAPAHNIIMNPADSDGNVGIGTTNPTHKLDVKAKSIKLGLEGNGGGQLILKNNAGDNKIYLEGFNSAGTASADEMLLTGKDGGKIAHLTFIADNTRVAGNFLRVDGAGNEQCYFGGDGSFKDVQIGSSQPDVKTVSLYNTSSTSSGAMDLWCRSTIHTSDAALKTDVKPLANALTTILQLRGVSFRWKSEIADTTVPPEHGLIAQEVETVLPQAVKRTRSGAGVAYTSLVPLLIEAVKELKEEQDRLRAELSDMKAKANGLRTKRSTTERGPKK